MGGDQLKLMVALHRLVLNGILLSVKSGVWQWWKLILVHVQAGNA